MIPADLCYEDIAIGAVYEFERLIAKEDGMRFAELTGDYSPLHTDPLFGAKSQFGEKCRARNVCCESFFHARRDALSG